MQHLIALIDCNNFFVSCERVFNPKLIGRPVVVLSNNDGCIIARSGEAKKLGIPMGAPLFEWASLIEQNHVITLSSNFSLYADMSGRVMATIAKYHPEMEVYSIDEAFLSLNGIKNPLSHAQNLIKKILQHTGIPVSIGIAPTKTLAKIAGDLAKKTFNGLFSLVDKEKIENVLSHLSTQEVWGIGSRMSRSLQKYGIHTALQFRDLNNEWLKKYFSVVAVRVALELRGTSCLGVEDMPSSKQSMLTSRSFERAIFGLEELHEKVASFAARGGEKLREEGSYASALHVFVASNSHQEEFYSRQATMIFPEPTHFTPTLIQAAYEGLKKIYRQGVAYKRAGVLLTGLVSAIQKDFFAQCGEALWEKQKLAIAIVDQANARFGYPILHFAAEGNREVRKENQKRSPCFTTRWDELLTIKI